MRLCAREAERGSTFVALAQDGARSGRTGLISFQTRSIASDWRDGQIVRQLSWIGV